MDATTWTPTEKDRQAAQRRKAVARLYTAMAELKCNCGTVGFWRVLKTTCEGRVHKLRCLSCHKVEKLILE